MQVTVDLEKWDKDPKSINSVCSAMTVTEFSGEPTVNVVISILSDKQNKLYYHQDGSAFKKVLVQPDLELQGYFLICKTVFQALLEELVEEKHAMTMQNKTGMIPTDISFNEKTNEITIGIIIAVADDVCNNNYFKGYFQDLKKEV